MKAIFKFNLPEEQEEYQMFIDASKMHNALCADCLEHTEFETEE